MDFSLNIWDLSQTYGIYSRPVHFTQDPYILLQTREFNSEFMNFYSRSIDFIQDPWILLQMHFNPYPWILLRIYGFYSRPNDFTPDPWILFRTH